MDAGVNTPQLVTPPNDATSFVIDGVAYTATPDICISRYKQLQIWEIACGFDRPFAEVWAATTEIKQAIDERKSISDIAYINERVRRGLQAVERKEVFQLLVVSLWFLGPDENPTQYDHELNIAKVNRWEAGGLGMGFLFAKAASCVRGFREAWLQSRDQQLPENDQ
jgi:hypothetical protein